ncbi:uncharacterized protein LOC129592915 [Paramacrobiotus metropolitanus]|uniref:uncharacterized protein LOC129592915 n=1 Tax=Paramacrobiotus metropolitanus TaxID=2943436 RepID=UPI0024455FA9|nr:uncharacterized protein LOC129592915 [Paramacrobiotus metropolitanus]
MSFPAATTVPMGCLSSNDIANLDVEFPGQLHKAREVECKFDRNNVGPQIYDLFKREYLQMKENPGQYQFPRSLFMKVTGNKHLCISRNDMQEHPAFKEFERNGQLTYSKQFFTANPNGLVVIQNAGKQYCPLDERLSWDECANRALWKSENNILRQLDASDVLKGNPGRHDAEAGVRFFAALRHSQAASRDVGYYAFVDEVKIVPELCDFEVPCVLKELDRMFKRGPRPGITKNQLLISAGLTGFGSHCEDGMLASFNFLFTLESVIKSWMGIPVEHFPLAKKIFADKYAQVIAPDTATCDDIGVNHLHKLLILADWRDFLRQGGHAWYIEQGPGDLVLVGCGVIHQGGQIGRNEAIAGNFADIHNYRDVVIGTDLYRQCPDDIANNTDPKATSRGMCRMEVFQMEAWLNARDQLAKATNNPQLDLTSNLPLPESVEWYHYSGRAYAAQERLRQDDILLPEKPTSFEPPALTTRFLVRRKFPLSCLVWGSKVPHPDVRPVSLSYANDLRHHLRNHRTDETPDTVGWTVTGVVFYNKPDGTWEDVEKLVNNGKIKISIYDGAQRCAAAEMMGWEELDVCLYLNPTAEEQKFLCCRAQEVNAQVALQYTGKQLFSTARKCVEVVARQHAQELGIPDNVPVPFSDDQAVDDTVDLPDSVPITNPDHRFHFTPVPTTQQSKPLASAKLLFIKHYPTLLSNLEPAMPGICDDHQALTKDQSEAIGWLLKIACYPRALQSKFDQLWDLVERRAKPAVDNLARRENKLGSLFCVLLTPRKLHDLRQLRKDDPWPMVDFALDRILDGSLSIIQACKPDVVKKRWEKLRKVPWPTTKRALPEPEEKRPSTVKLSRGATRSTRTAYSRAAASKQPPVILPVTTSTTSSSGDMRHSTPLPASSGKRCRTLDEHFGADVSAIKSTEDDGEHEHNGDHNQEEAHHPSTGDEEPSAKRRKTIKSLSGDGGSSDSVVVSAEQSPTASAGQEPGTATPSPSSTSLDAVEEEQSPTHSIPPNDEMEVASTSQSLPNSVKPDAEAQSLQDSGRGSGSEPNPPSLWFFAGSERQK